MVELIDVELIQDNPFQPRTVYHRQDINDLAASIETHGLLQIPPARRKNGEVQLGFGHLRKRAFLKLAKKKPAKWGKMPLDIRELTDEQMALFALEENLRRRDITPIEVARAVDKYLTQFSDKTEVEMARQLSMTQGNISNMRRVLKLPAKVLEKVDQGRITFTQARELITLKKLGDEPENLMLAAIRDLRSEGRYYGHANTVEGMQASVHDVILNHCRPLDKAYEGYRWNLIFNTRAVGCLKCEKMVRTHPTKSATAHFCIDAECWDRHQKEQQEKVSADAKAKMEADILRRAAEQAPTISQEIPGSQPEEVAAADQEVEKQAEETVAIPEDILAQAREKAGTRAEVLDLKDIGGGYYQEVGQGYALLDGVDRALEHVIDPEECLERCTKGFHFAFDSRQDSPRTRYVCSDPKCLTKKKAAFTRAKNAEGQARKNAERKALREAIAQTTIIDRPRLKLILLAQMDGGHTTRHYYGPTDGKKPETWIWEKLSAGTPEIKRERKDLFKRIDKLTHEELARLVVEFMLYYLTDKGDIGSYEVKTAEALKWMGVEIKIEPVKAKTGKSEHEQIEDSLPCKDCQNAPTCDRSHFYTDGKGGYVCDHQVRVQEEVAP